MAEPFENSETSQLPFVNADPSCFSATRAPGFRKRIRGSDDDPTDIAEDSHKTRRVNPQRLAARLGADLVAEMEALIYPGAKMPSFEVRRVIQERYAVDRRHIYDYFHSRGLRVAKEDRHVNLTRGRLSKALARQLPEKLQPDPGPVEESAIASPANEIASNASQSAEHEQIERNATPVKLRLKLKVNANLKSPQPLPLRSAKRIASEKIFGLNHRRRRHTLSMGNSNATASKDLLSKARRRLPPATPVSADVHPILHARTPSPSPEFTLLDESPGSGSSTLHFPDSQLSYDLFFDQHGIANALSLDPFNDYECHALAGIEEHRPLTQLERLEMYNLINDSIRSSGGIEECAGTYSTYMKERLQNYYDRISFKTSYGARIYRVHQGELHSGTTALGDDDHVDFQKWLSCPYQQEENSPVSQPAPESGECYVTQGPWPSQMRALSSYAEAASKGVESCLNTRSGGPTPSTVADGFTKSTLGDEEHSAEAEASGLPYEHAFDLPLNPRISSSGGNTEGRLIDAAPTLQFGRFSHKRSQPQPSSHARIPSMEPQRRPMTILDPNAPWWRHVICMQTLDDAYRAFVFEDTYVSATHSRHPYDIALSTAKYLDTFQFAFLYYRS
ncbi:hypothetical protein LshimejAT787_0300510 [Lyophyllum shimeji]|uniref:Uncharacterized protein n=1 Tax=Lyophyllum shimeji TaxID=47721 RepID=A0A9P3PHX1_LYOSH|nr:hypothetical protein LshimejAT787_0300510 [Lyophyllum shimeji]